MYMNLYLSEGRSIQIKLLRNFRNLPILKLLNVWKPMFCTFLYDSTQYIPIPNLIKSGSFF